MSSLSIMPHEINTLICEFLCDHCVDNWDAPVETRPRQCITSEPLRMLCLTSESMRAAAHPVLFHFYLDESHSRDAKWYLRSLRRAKWQGCRLASSIKSLSLRHINQSSPQMTCDANNDERVQTYSRLFHCANNHYISSVLEIATRIQQLELVVESGNEDPRFPWIPPDTKYLCLQELNLCSTKMPGKLDAEIILAFIANKPLLTSLTLSNYQEVDESILQVVASIKNFTLNYHDDKNWRFSDIPNIKSLVGAMPRLKSFKFCGDCLWNPYDTPRKIISDLFIRKDTLQSLMIHLYHDSREFDKLKQFSKLTDLDIFAPSPRANNIQVVQLPPFLKHLQLRVHYVHRDTLKSYLDILSLVLSSSPGLESVHIILHSNGYPSDTSNPLQETDMKGVAERFVDAGVKLSFAVEKRNIQSSFLLRAWGAHISDSWDLREGNMDGLLSEESDEPGVDW